MKYVDVHVGKPMVETDQSIKWFEQCLDSLDGEPIRLHIVDPIPGDLRRVRYEAFQLGESEYVSFVDADDFIKPGAFQACIDALEINPDVCGCYTTYDIIDENDDLIRRPRFVEWNPSLSHALKVHQLIVMRREDVVSVMRDNYDIIAPIFNEMFCTTTLMGLKKPWLAIPFNGYTWRKTKMGAHRTHFHPSYDRTNFIQLIS